MTGGPGEGQIFCPPADHGNGVKRQKVVAAQAGKPIFSTGVGSRVINDREEPETPMPVTSPGAGDRASGRAKNSPLTRTACLGCCLQIGVLFWQAR